MAKKKRISEFTSYIYIKQELAKLGWNTKNPARNPTGEVYTQQECLDQDEIKLRLIRQKPEYVVKLEEDKFYIIEAKPTLDEIDVAFSEAKKYAEQINKSKTIKAVVISGVAGNDEDGYSVKSAYLEGNKFKTVNYHGREITSLVSREISSQLLSHKTASIPELKIDEKQLLRVAERINEVLHAGSINKDERASVMAALLLSMVDDTRPNYNANPIVFVKDINNRAEDVLLNNSKREFFKHIEIKLPSNKDAQVKYKNSLVTTMFELLKINIKAAMNSGSDVLGQFYEVFLKYGNGAKDIGIVLTPRHITHFVARVLNITHKDIVYDPTCGTGGFLVAAFDHVRENSTKGQLDYFKKHKIFGIEQQPKVACLAIVNMIFRGDGKNNIVDNDCLSQSLIKTRLNGEETAEYIRREKHNDKPAVTKVLMNPPFALKDKDEKEFNFVQHALEQMEDGGMLFAVLPLSVMLKGAAYKTWRKNQLLANNSLLSVITFPEDLFYPVGVNTCGIFIKKGYPHKPNQPVLWVRAMYDGYAKLKGKRLPDIRVSNLIEKIETDVKNFLQDTSTKIKPRPEFIKICPIDFSDSALELTPEVYLDSHTPTLTEVSNDMEQLLREYVAFLIRNKKEEEING
ncbi:MAG: N-6 DNA methylase [Bacteroidota bacterium]|nr:N-6 DNA methylase [Bacteroidota bacterium]